jgi:hypothetical protein
MADSFQPKTKLLLEIMKEKEYAPEEMQFILENLSEEWFTFEQTKEEIESQLFRSFGIWRGLADAIIDILEFGR